MVLEQHAELLASLWTVRSGVSVSPDARLADMARLDERIAAQQDGCVVAGSAGLAQVTSQLAPISAGRVFAAASVAVELRHTGAFDRCVALAEAEPAAFTGLKSALGWADPSRLRGVAKRLLDSESPIQQALGVAACRLHGINPGPILEKSAQHADCVPPSAEVFRTIGTLGSTDLSPHPSTPHANSVCGFFAAWASVLTGDRSRGLNELLAVACAGTARADDALRLALQASSMSTAHSILTELATTAEAARRVIAGAGIAGDPKYVPWLLSRMGDDAVARIAGEAFTLISGVDFQACHISRPRPDDFESGPNDDPDDPNIDMDRDEGLPWPDVKKVEAWWHANEHRFQKGTRYFMGQPVTKEHGIHVLKTGYQRQRILAAQYLCLLEPGTPLFNTAAPAWRQQRLLAAM
jgi:uncharacterized protein (TIGR02270 family)